jgi:hypothetical protein
MKLAGVISTAVLSLTLAVAAPAFAQQDQHDQQEQKDKPAAQGEKKEQPARPAKPDEKPAPQQEKNAQQQDRDRQQQEKNVQQQDRDKQQQEKNVQQQDKNNQQQEKSAQQRDRNAKPEQPQRVIGNRGGRIPDDRFRASFGQEHRFRVTQTDYSRDRRFQYGGYWFGFVDPWPSNWLYTQDVYVVDINGVYYLCNPMYPGVNVALSVTL